MNSKSHIRLWLYILIGTLPAIVDWLTLTFDMSPRGLAILTTKTVLAACITARAYLDTGGKPSDQNDTEKPKPPVVDVHAVVTPKPEPAHE